MANLRWVKFKSRDKYHLADMQYWNAGYKHAPGICMDHWFSDSNKQTEPFDDKYSPNPPIL